MGHWFSRHKSRVTEHDKAVLQLKLQRDELVRYKKRLGLSIEKDVATIKELVKRGQKQRALLLLKKKKCEENLLDQSEKQLNTVEGLINDIEFAQVELQVLDGLKKGNEALKKLNALMKMDDVEKILADAQEAQQYQEELSNLIAGNLTASDDREVEAELQRLLTEEGDGDSAAAKLPSVPDHDVPAPQPVKKPQGSPSSRKSPPKAVLASG